MEREELLDKEMHEAKVMPNTFISSVFMYMFLGLGLTGITSWLFYETQMFMSLINPVTGGFNMLGYVIMFAPLALVLVMQMAYHRFSIPVLLLFFGIYAVLLGMSLSFIFAIYTASSIALTFAITAGMYGTMALLGYTTNVDLTKFGTIMMMGFWGIFIAAIVNFFVGSELLDYVISGIGVLVFTGLTAYKMQELKYIGSDPELGNESRGKLAIIGGLQMYILFVNLFLSLLRFFGGRD